MKAVLLLAALALALPLPAAAQMYKCVDERGVTHYTDKPRPGCKGGEVDIRGSPSISGGVARPPQDVNQQEADFQRRRIERERADEKSAAQRARQEERCAGMHLELQRMSSARRLVTVDAKGERTEVDEAARNARIENLKSQIGRQCPQ